MGNRHFITRLCIIATIFPLMVQSCSLTLSYGLLNDCNDFEDKCDKQDLRKIRLAAQWAYKKASQPGMSQDFVYYNGEGEDSVITQNDVDALDNGSTRGLRVRFNGLTNQTGYDDDHRGLRCDYFARCSCGPPCRRRLDDALNDEESDALNDEGSNTCDDIDSFLEEFIDWYNKKMYQHRFASCVEDKPYTVIVRKNKEQVRCDIDPNSEIDHECMNRN